MRGLYQIQSTRRLLQNTTSVLSLWWPQFLSITTAVGHLSSRNNKNTKKLHQAVVSVFRFSFPCLCVGAVGLKKKVFRRVVDPFWCSLGQLPFPSLLSHTHTHTRTHRRLLCRVFQLRHWRGKPNPSSTTHIVFMWQVRRRRRRLLGKRTK